MYSVPEWGKPALLQSSEWVNTAVGYLARGIGRLTKQSQFSKALNLGEYVTTPGSVWAQWGAPVLQPNKLILIVSDVLNGC